MKSTTTTPSGRDVRAAAGLNPASSFVLIHVRDRGSTSVGLDDKLDLKAGKVEIFRAFESDRIFTFTLDERAFEWGNCNGCTPMVHWEFPAPLCSDSEALLP